MLIRAVESLFSQFCAYCPSPNDFKIVLNPKFGLYRYFHIKMMTIDGTSMGTTNAVFTNSASLFRRIKKISSAAVSGKNTLLNTVVSVI